MADFNALQALIDAYIKRNGVKAITGQILNGVLSGMVSALGKGYTIAGEATPTTDPGTMTGPVAYVAHSAGTYEHFGNLVVEQGEVAMLIFNEAVWHKETLLSLSADASVDDNVGTPEVTCTFVDGVLTFDFRNMKGEPGTPGTNGTDGRDGTDGQDGAAAGFGTVSATIDGNVGTPSVSVQTSGPNTAKNFAFQFSNLKGETGVSSVVVTVDNTTGNPSCAVSLVNSVLHLDFTGLKGAQGNTGSSVDYPFTIVNNLTTDDATQALSAAMGVQLESEISQLEAKLNNLANTRYYGIFTSSADLPADASENGYAYVGSSTPLAIYEFDGEDWNDTGVTVNSIQGEPGEDGVGFASVASPTPADGTVTITLSNGDTITLDLNHNHPAYYSKAAETSNPSGGFLPDVVYSLGTLTGTVTFALAAAVTGNVNHYFWMFDTSSTAPTITWPTGITWAAGSAPTVAASKHYEISVLNGIAYYSEV